MGKTSKSLAVFIVLIMAISSVSLMIAKPTSAQSIPKPSIPQFTLKFVDNSYDVPPTYGIDQFTGKQVITQEGYHVDGRTAEFTIKNQPFTSYNDTSDNYIDLYYNFRFKGNYGEEWTYYPFDGTQATHSYGGLGSGDYFHYSRASNSDYTIILISLKDLTTSSVQSIPYNSLVDFQVQTQIGHIDSVGVSMGMGSIYSFIGQASDWSNTQTITIGSTSTSPTPTPTVPEFSSVALVLLLLMGISVAVLVITRRRKVDC